MPGEDGKQIALSFRIRQERREQRLGVVPGPVPPSRENSLTSDQCVIDGEAFFVRGLIEIPVVDSDHVFTWRVWASLSKENFARADKLWETTGRENEPPYFGRISTDLGLYSPSTINLKSHVHTRPVGQRPLIELEPTDHPLAVEQRSGITLERVQEIAEAIMHPDRQA